MPSYQDPEDAPPAAAPTSGNGDRLAALRAEIDGYHARIRSFERLETAEVFLQMSGISARMCEVRAQLFRSTSRHADRLRREEVDPLVEELDRQFRLHSRVEAIRQIDARLAGVAP